MLPGDERPVMAPNGQALLTASACDSLVTLEPTPGGFDLVLVVSNGTAIPQARPGIALTGLRLAPRLTYLDARRTGALKPATLATGVVVQVPLFVEPGEKVKVDTRTGAYIERVK